MFTRGGSIAFAPGSFSEERLGHELRHVRESALGGILENIAGMGINFDETRESAADSAGAAFASGSEAQTSPVSLFGMGDSAPVLGTWQTGLMLNIPARFPASPVLKKAAGGAVCLGRGAFERLHLTCCAVHLVLPQQADDSLALFPRNIHSTVPPCYKFT